MLKLVAYGHDRDSKTGELHAPAPARVLEDAYPAAATAAVALAQLHNHRPDSDWESEIVRYTSMSKLLAITLSTDTQ